MFHSIRRVAFVGLTFMALFVLAACAPAPTPAPTLAPPTIAVTVPTAPSVPTTGPTKAPTIAPTIAATTAPTVAPTTAPTVAATTAPLSAASGKIALLLPETKTARYETADRPYFEARFKQLCPACTIIYSNANQDASAQISQVEAALTNGAKVLVLDPVDSAAAGALADKAKAQGVPVIAYDRLILNSSAVNFYISFDNARVGTLQAQSLVDQLTKLGKANPQLVMINGAPTDNNAKLFKQGAHSIFDPLATAKSLTIAKEYDTPDWSPDQAQNEMQQALTALGNKVDGVYAANDGTGGGAIAAMKAAGLTPLPPVTGQDAELAAIQRILKGEQYMTVYKAIKPEAETAAELAYDLLTNTAVPASMTQGKTVNNNKMDVPSVLLTPIAVTKDNVKDTIVKDNFWTVQQICTADLSAACQAAGLASAPAVAATTAPSVPTTVPTAAPTVAPTKAPTTAPTVAPTVAPTAAPTKAPTVAATTAPTAASGKIALLLPETKTARYETADRPYFEARFKQLCPACTIIYSNANQDASAQISQVEAALTNGAKVLVLDPVDSAAAGALADKAKAQGVPVIAYDRLILNSSAVNFYISFDNARVGTLQAQSLVDQLTKLGKANPQLVMINGAPTDNNAKLFKQGAHSVFDPLATAKSLTIAKEYDTPDWSPDQAQNEMQQALTALGNKVDGVYAANDGTGGGAIAAMKAAGLTPLPPVTGQDAELAAIQRILKGEQYMTVYKAIKPEAETAAELAFALLTNTAVPATVTQGKTVNNNKMDVPSVLLTPVAVTKDNVKDTIVKDNFWTVQQICTADVSAACKAAGLDVVPAVAPTTAPSAASGKIALLLPETKTARYETADRPYFEARFKQLCPACTIIYSNANQDASAQISQVEAALTNGAKVLVLDPVDSAAAGALADKAKAQGVPVIAYDRLILNSSAVNFYISFDNARVGTLQAQSLVDQLTKLGKANPQLVMINGAPTDNNAKLFKQGAHSIFDPLATAKSLTIAKEYDTPDWSPDQAQNEMQQALTALGNKVDGVYAANDGTGGGAIAAMKAAGLTPLPPVTGQDAELAAIQRILKGEQYMTVYKAIKPEAETAAELAFALLTNTAVPATVTQGKTVNNNKMDVPSVLLTPVAVTKDNVKDTIVKDNFWTVQQICTADVSAACKAAGLQ